MKHSLNVFFYEKFMNLEKTKENLEKLIFKNSVEFDSLEETIDALNKTQKNFFISQLNLINKLSRKEYNNLLSMDITTRNGLNYKTVNQIGEYRFTQVIRVDNNVLTRRYFILDFNNTSIVDGVEVTNEIYEIDTKTFSILISEICSAKQDIEDNLYVDEAKEYLDHMKKVIGRFIKKYHELKELNQELDKD